MHRGCFLLDGRWQRLGKLILQLFQDHFQAGAHVARNHWKVREELTEGFDLLLRKVRCGGWCVRSLRRTQRPILLAVVDRSKIKAWRSCDDALDRLQASH